MPDASPRRPAPGGLTRSSSFRRFVLAIATGALLAAVPPSAMAAGEVTLSTPYPAVAVPPGEKVSFEISVRTDVGDRVDLSVEEVPADWIATLRGEGFVVDSVQTQGDDPVSITLDVTVPDGAAAGTQRVRVSARSGSARDTLDLDLRVEETAAGQVTFASDFPELEGAAGSTISYSVRLTNDTAEDLTFSLQASGPPGWSVEASPSSQAQAASVIVEAGADSTINVSVDVPEGAPAETYPILVQATSESRSVEAQLAAIVTGSFEMDFTTQGEVLSARGSAGSAIQQNIVLNNTGTSALENVTLSGTPPSGWEVTFEPETLTVPPGGQGTATARIVPSGDAIAGDYVVRFRASTDQANDEFELRVTIETSLLWGIVGIGLIALVVIGLGWVFRRYGRR
jgi:uncharacterized membrane protein